jgi:hypothetical protein
VRLVAWALLLGCAGCAASSDDRTGGTTRVGQTSESTSSAPVAAATTSSLGMADTSAVPVTTASSTVPQAVDYVRTVNEASDRLSAYAPECDLVPEPPPEVNPDQVTRPPIADGKADGLGLDSEAAVAVYGCQSGVMILNIAFFDSSNQRDDGVDALLSQYGPPLREAGQTLVVAVAVNPDGPWLAWAEKVDQLEPTPSFTLEGILRQVAEVLGGTVYQIEF